MTRTRALALLALVALTLAGSACGDDDAVEARDDAPTGRPDDVVMSIRTAGGFVPQGVDFAAVPTLVLRDGTVLTGGAVIAIFPGPALTPVVTGQIPEAEVAALVEAAATAGLDAPPLDAGQPGVTDVPTTTITVAFPGGTRRHDVYALGIDAPDDALSEEQRAARQAVGDVVARVTDQVAAAATEPYAPPGYQVLAFPVDRADLAGSDVAPNELAWPFADLPLAEGPCLDIDGDRTTALAEALAQATQITVWTDPAGATWQLAVRATLPGDQRCRP